MSGEIRSGLEGMVAFAADTRDDHVLRIRYAHRVTDAERKALIEMHNALATERAAREKAERERDALRKAAKPFAIDDWHRDEPDHWPAFGQKAGEGWPTVGDFRRIAALLRAEGEKP